LPLVYAGFDANGTYRLFVTKDGGDSWSELPSPPSDGQLGFNNVITVGPYSSDEVYIGQIAFWRSLDGGRKGGINDYHVSPPVESNSWTVLGCCLSDSNPFRKNLDLHGDLHAIDRRGSEGKASETTISANAQQVCVQSFTHGLQLSWDVFDGVPPVAVKAEIAYPDKHIEWSLSSSRAIRLFP
jgi:hypothetical protein